MSSSRGAALVVPDEFIAELAGGGDRVLRWIRSLPDLVGELADAWELELDFASPRFGANALVLLGERRGEPCALKASRPDHRVTAEAEALQVWNGHGAVRLLEWSSKDNVLLLEGLDPDRSLEAVSLDEVAEVIGRLVRQLAVPAPQRFRGSLDLGEVTRGHHSKQRELGAPLPDEWVQLAIGLLADLLATASGMLVPSDLHSANVLAGPRQSWLAIDPRPVVGEPEVAVADVLLWRLPLDAEPSYVTALVETIVRAGDLDMRKAREWVVVRAVGHWLWCCDADFGLPPGAPRCSVCAPRCTQILAALT